MACKRINWSRPQAAHSASVPSSDSCWRFGALRAA
jgi:hypothetical protein